MPAAAERSGSLSKAAAWADQPLKLIAFPAAEGDLADHGAIFAATQMTHVHNVFIRGLNSILLQGPCIPSSDMPGYSLQDTKDLLAYTSICMQAIEHHHWIEETCLFPEIEKLAGAKAGLMNDPKHQHETFTPGMHRLQQYCTADGAAEKHRWDGEGGMQQMLDEISQPLYEHLKAEIDHLATLTYLDSDGIKLAWKKMESLAREESILSMLRGRIPFVLGASDRTREGAADWPAVPSIMPYIVKYWFASGNGAWRFSPCDFWGTPKPLQFAKGSPTPMPYANVDGHDQGK